MQAMLHHRRFLTHASHIGGHVSQGMSVSETDSILAGAAPHLLKDKKFVHVKNSVEKAFRIVNPLHSALP